MADNYNVGNILINLETKVGTIDKTLSETTRQLSQLKRVVSGISNINLDKFQRNLSSISQINFNNIKEAFNPISQVDTKSLSSFNRQIKNISKINLDNLNFDKLKNDFTSLANSIDPFIQKIKEAEPSLQAFSNAIDLGNVNAKLMVAEAKVSAINQKAQSKKVLDDIKIEKANLGLEKTKSRLEAINEKSEKTKSLFGKIFNIGKIYFWINYTKRIANVFAKWVQSAITFDETLNKFQVSFGEYTQEARKFANEITQAFNLSTESVLNYMSTFNNMLTALGSLSRDTATQLSETLTRMAIDYASLFNVSIETAMNQFQSVLSGSIRPIRSTSGYDVSETSIYTLYQQLGGTKTMRQLTQLEKRLLRILAIQKQMSETGAVGDFEKTINNTANQLKQIGETLKEFGRWLGTLLLGYLRPIVETTLTISIVLKEITKSFAILNGYTETIFEQGNAFDGMTDSVSETNDEIDKLKNKLLSFDRFEALNQSDNEGVSSDLEMLVSSLATYSSSLSEISSKANETAKSIMQWLGFTEQLNPETNDVYWSLDKIFNRFELILGTIKTLITLGITRLITGYITKIQIARVEMALLEAQTGKNIASFSLLNSVITSLAIVAILELIFNFEKLSKTARILYTTIIFVATAILILKNRLIITKLISSLGIAITFLTATMTKAQLITLAWGSALFMLMGAFAIFTFMDEWSAKTKTLVGILVTLVAGLTTATVAWLAYYGAMSRGTAIPVILGSIAVGAAGVTSLIKGNNQYADGGFPTTGSLFIANEKGPELVGNIGGRTAVANNDMIVQGIENASYRGYVRAMQVQNQNKDKIEFDFSGTNDSALARLIAKPLVDELRSQGYEIRKA